MNTIITIKDIAKKAGVSPTTVSNVINGNHSKVSQSTIDTVEAIIKQYNYVPNMSARTLVSNSSKIIGVILPKETRNKLNFSQSPFQSEILSGLEYGVQAKNYYLMMRSISCYEEIYRLLQNWKVDGLIILGLLENQSLQLINAFNIPILFVDTYIDDKSIMSVGLQDEEGSYLATSYLIEKGHTKIGFISYDLVPKTVSSERLKGFKRALLERNLPLDDSHIIEFKDTLNTSTSLQQKLLHTAQQVTSFCCSTDMLAIEVMAFLKSKTYNFPDDLSIVGFDNLYISSLVTPKLTTIEQDIFQKGVLAAHHLIDNIEGKSLENKQIKLPVTLIERESVKQL